MKQITLSSLLLAAAGLAAAAVPAAAQTPDEPVRLAQFFEDDPFYDRDSGPVEIYVDEYGRRVVIDAFGRIIAAEPSRRQRFQERRQRFRERAPIILEGPPPPGAVLEGRVGEVLPFEPDVFEDAPPSADPFYDGPIEATPLPEPEPRYEPPPEDNRLDAALPDAEPSLDDLPEPGDPIVQPGETTVPESDPAPVIAGPKGKHAKAETAALQVILDRAGMSPGVIDGRMGSNVNKAVAAYQEKYGRTLDATDAQALAEELDATGGPAVISYTITEADVGGPYVASIPADYGEKAQMPAMSFERVSEMLAEKFHMDEGYLQEINPGADFSRPGTIIKVMAVGEAATGEVARIVADKGREQVRAYDASGKLVVAYPSTIGSSDTPSPSGTVQVNRIAFDPNYTYNPKINFKQGENDKVLTIPPGPNGPVGSIWIALSKPTYGIHGTPEPSKIGKTNSHGCVRLTNWDAQELAKMVEAGVIVEFTE